MSILEPQGVCDTNVYHKKNPHTLNKTCINWRPVEASVITEAYAANDGTWIKASAPAAPPITHERAREAAQRLINSAFDQKPRAILSIPAQPDKDDDLIICRYIEQQAAPKNQTQTIEEVMRKAIFNKMSEQEWGDLDLSGRSRAILDAILPILRSGK